LLKAISIDVQAYLLESAEVKRRTAQSCLEPIHAAAGIFAESLRRGGKLLVCGNGGSAADSQHIVGEFVSVLDKNRTRPAMPAIALTTDSSILTAIANDFGYERVFERQVEALGTSGDVLLGISTSGNSENVICAVLAARNKSMKTVVLTGQSGGKLAELADVAICVPSGNTQHIQESHLALEHLLSLLTEAELFGEEE
jgi:D-sedoheptulose 7-phosphate isomerase